MTTEIKNKIADALETYLLENEMSANDFVKKTGINEAYVTYIRDRSFKVGQTELHPKWLEAVAKNIGFQIKKNYWKKVFTNQTTEMLSILEDAKEDGSIKIIIGETGCGKTYTSELFAEKNPKYLYVIKVGSSDNLSDLIDKIMVEAKISASKTKSKNIRNIVAFFQKLKFNGHKPMIIFDECEYMKQPTLCMIKELYDGLIKHCAVILVGTDELTDKIERMRKRKVEGMRQFYRRIKFNIRILPTINISFKEFLNEDEDKSLIKFLQLECDNYGDLHDVLVPSRREAERLGEPLTENLVRKVLNLPKI